MQSTLYLLTFYFVIPINKYQNLKKNSAKKRQCKKSGNLGVGILLSKDFDENRISHNYLGLLNVK